MMTILGLEGITIFELFEKYDKENGYIENHEKEEA